MRDVRPANASVDEELPSKSDDPSLIPGTQVVKGQKHLQKSCSYLHTHRHTMAQEYVHVHK